MHTRGKQNPSYLNGEVSRYENRGKQNPTYLNGEVSKCALCGSTFHWYKDCPDASDQKGRCLEENNEKEKHL